MYEDLSNMNSEQSRNSRCPSMAPVSEAKTNKSDSSNAVGKLPGRNSKKRENGAHWNSAAGMAAAPSATFSGGTKTQKLYQTKPRSLDKRTRGQQEKSGFGSGYGTSRKNDYQIADSLDPDLDSFVPETGRKQNLAHLLNMKFQLAPRNSAAPYWRATHSDGNGGKSKRNYGHQLHRGHYNKDNYLQANCQFVVKADGDYSVYLADPDLLVQWESIEQIRIWGSEVGSCPICLHPPVAARMTRCGHIYCWPCVLHFLALSDKPSRPCPICDAPVKMQDLKSVTALEHRQLKVGEVVEMRLMKRDRHSLQPKRVAAAVQTMDSRSRNAPIAFLQTAGEHHVYSKLLLATPRDVVHLILDWEKKDLLEQWDREKDCPESCFIQQALELLAVRQSLASVDELPTPTPQVVLPQVGDRVSDLMADLDLGASSDGGRSRYTSVSSEGLVDHHLPEDLDRCVGSPPVRGVHHGPVQQQQQQKNVFYFYQSSDGQAVYLHPLNVQMLVRQYGALEACPDVIRGRVVEWETMSMTEELRHRMRYLGHLPLCSQFQIMEVALEAALVDCDVVDEFRERIEERERRRRRKDREERRRDKEIQRAEEAKWGRSKNQPIVRLDSQVHFPEFSPTSTEWDPPLTAQAGAEDGYQQNVQSTSPNEDVGVRVRQSSGPSFAQMLRQGKCKVAMWPAVSTAATPEPVVWGRPAGSGRVRNDSDAVDADCTDYGPAPEFRETFSSALAAAFDKAAKSIADGGAATVGAVENRPGKKGKKTKQKVLFATGMNFM